MVLTSHDRLGDSGEKTGFWFEEFATPYYIFKDAGAEITLASPKGGQPPMDPRSDKPDARTEATERFKADTEGRSALANTLKLSEVSANDYDAVFYPGGHGPLWDLVDDKTSMSIIESMHAAGKPVAAVCHGPAVLKRPVTADGTPLVNGRSVTGFSNSEEEAVQLTEVVPFLVEEMLKQNGGNYTKAEDWLAHAEVDGNLITGQNPASSGKVALALLKQIS